MSTENQDPSHDAADKITDGDILATLTRAGLVMIGPLGSLLGEFVPSASERQTQRSLRTLQRKFEDLREIVTTEMWTKAQATEEFDAAFVRTLHASQETAQEEKREFLWQALINGWVRPEGDAERHRFLRLVTKYDLEHFELLIELQQYVSTHSDWMAFETSTTGQTLVDALRRDRLELLAYLQEFQGDGLLMIQDQPTGGVNSLRKSVLWRPDADQLIRFVRDPRFEWVPAGSPGRGAIRENSIRENGAYG